MAIAGLDHFNILTDDVEAARRFYVGILGLAEGPRPPLAFDGAWLYIGGHPVVHISAGAMPRGRAGVIDHVAFRATDLRGTAVRLDESGVAFALRRQVGTGTWQLFCHDPMGAKVELDFDAAEPPPEGYAPGEPRRG